MTGGARRPRAPATAPPSCPAPWHWHAPLLGLLGANTPRQHDAPSFKHTHTPPHRRAATHGARRYVLLDDVLRTYQNKYSVQDVRDEVVSNTKQRLGLREDADGTLYIRANQGHTLEGLDEHALLQPVKSAGEVPVCLHGTYAAVLPLILQTGLSRMARNHIHFARGLPEGDTGVISGMRSSCQVPATRCSSCRWGWVLGGAHTPGTAARPGRRAHSGGSRRANVWQVLVDVDVARAMAAGIEFFVSANGVILSPGALVASCQPLHITAIYSMGRGTQTSPTAPRTAESCVRVQGVRAARHGTNFAVIWTLHLCTSCA